MPRRDVLKKNANAHFIGGSCRAGSSMISNTICVGPCVVPVSTACSQVKHQHRQAVWPPVHTMCGAWFNCVFTGKASASAGRVATSAHHVEAHLLELLVRVHRREAAFAEADGAPPRGVLRDRLQLVVAPRPLDQARVGARVDVEVRPRDRVLQANSYVLYKLYR